MKQSSDLYYRFDNESYPVALYDMSIIDVKERMDNRIVFDKAIKAANFLGMVPSKFYEKLGNKHYCYHRDSRKKYAVRKISTIK